MEQQKEYKVKESSKIEQQRLVEDHHQRVQSQGDKTKDWEKSLRDSDDLMGVVAQATIQKLDLEKTDITCELEATGRYGVCIDPGVFLHKNKREKFMLRKLTALIDEQPCFVLELYHESNKYEKPIYTKVIAQVKDEETSPHWIATWQNGKDLYFF